MPIQERVQNSKFKIQSFGNFRFGNTVKGFTLIELMIVIAIIAVLAAVGYATYANSQMLARDAKRKQDIRSVQAALEVYYERNNHYPDSVAGNWEKGCTDPATCSQGMNWIFGGDYAPYINILPLEANNPANAYQYYGKSSGKTCYELVAPLENDNDADNNLNKPQNQADCGPPGSAGPFDSSFDHDYIVVSP